MKTAACLLALGLVTSVFLGSPCNAAEPDPTIDSVLARWEEASKACRTFDARFTVTRYGIFGNVESSANQQGRFYYEAPGSGRYESNMSPGGNDIGAREGLDDIVWTNDRVFKIDHQNKTCTSFSSAEAQLVRKRINLMPERTFWERFQKGLGGIAWPCWIARPDDALPLFLLSDGEHQRKRFDFSAEHDDGKIFVKATPKQKDLRFCEINVMLDARSYCLLAHRRVTEGQTTDHVFDDVKINIPPADRESLMKPVPKGYREDRLDLIVEESDGPKSDRR